MAQPLWGYAETIDPAAFAPSDIQKVEGAHELHIEELRLRMVSGWMLVGRRFCGVLPCCSAGHAVYGLPAGVLSRHVLLLPWTAPHLPGCLQEASLGQSPPLTDTAVHQHLHKEALHLSEKFREDNKRALLNVVSGGCGCGCECGARLGRSAECYLGVVWSASPRFVKSVNPMCLHPHPPTLPCCRHDLCQRVFHHAGPSGAAAPDPVPHHRPRLHGAVGHRKGIPHHPVHRCVGGGGGGGCGVDGAPGGGMGRSVVLLVAVVLQATDVPAERAASAPAPACPLAILCCADILLGYHSEEGWTATLRLFSGHYGLEAEVRRPGGVGQGCSCTGWRAMRGGGV